MKHIHTVLLAGLAIGTLVLSAAPRVTNAAAQPRTTMMSPYGAAAITSQAGSKVTGAVAITKAAGGLMVVVSAAGLKPMGSYPEHIHAGSCGGNGKIAYPLAQLVADAHGNATSVTTIKAMNVPAMGWYINVHDPKTFVPIGCGNVYNADQLVTLKPAGKSMVSGMAYLLGNMNPKGVMARKYSGTTVVTFVKGLVPGTIHPEHLYTGACGSNGAIKYPLANLTADARGYAVAATFFTGKIPMSGLYLNVHAPDFSVIACGNLTGASHM